MTLNTGDSRRRTKNAFALPVDWLTVASFMCDARLDSARDSMTARSFARSPDGDQGVDGTKSVLITGSSSGIGLSTAKAFILSGYAVYGVDRNPPSLPSLTHIYADLHDTPAIDLIPRQLPSRICGLVNSAGLSGMSTPTEILAVNFVAAKRLLQAIVPLLDKGSSIVNVASISTYTSLPNAAIEQLVESIDTREDVEDWLQKYPINGPEAYRVSKNAIILWSSQLTLRLTKKKIRINCVSPGAVETPLLEKFRASMGNRVIDRSRLLLGRHANPDDVANVIRFLLSNESVWVNGNNILVDGGLTVLLQQSRAVSE